MQLSCRFVAVAVCLSSIGCSAADEAPAGGRQVPGKPSAGGSSAAVGGNGTDGNFGNGSGELPPVIDTPTTQPPATAPQGGARIPMSIDACGTGNPAGLSDTDAQKLMAGGAGALRMLNPYDGTVFPRGILPPLLMWDGDGGAEYVYLHIKSRLFEYKGCLTPTAAGQLLLPQDVWALAGDQTEGPVDPYVVELTVMAAGTVVGPVQQRWTIAQATLKGSIYYNSYASMLAGGMGIGGGSGSVLRIRRGQSAEVFLGQTGCTACHSVSANGARLVAEPLGGIPVGSDGASYALTPDGAPNPAPLAAPLANGAFPGLSPDGTLFITSAHGDGLLPGLGTGPRAGGPGTPGGPTAELFETDSGTTVAGSGVAQGAMMVMFSPDSSMLAFTDLAISDGHGLAVMDFDLAQRKASGYRQVYASPDTAKYPGWPFFLPDGKALVFALGASADFSGLGVGVISGSPIVGAPASDLYLVDIASGQAKVLAQAMGFASEQDAASGNTYLPFGGEELHQNYYPTVAPVPAGGYFWMFFDSIRHYGNEGLQRQIWGAAIDVSPDGTYAADASHPAFYLTGQEAGTGNHRAFAALDPCEMDGETCTSGTDCCGGFCYVKESDSEFATEPIGTCTAETPECAKINDRCTSTRDCCPPEPGQPEITCIAGVCAVLQPVL